MDKDFSLNFEEVLNMLLPCDYPHYTYNSKQEIKRDIPNEVEYAISKVLESELRIAEAFSMLATEISDRKDFNLYEAFRIIDKQKKNHLDVKK